jgi:hypothetical protein
LSFGQLDRVASEGAVLVDARDGELVFEKTEARATAAA